MTRFFFESTYCTPGERAFIQWGRYTDGSTAMQIIGLESGEPLVTATVCLAADHITPAPGNVIIKNWSENDGTYIALRDAEIIGAPVAMHHVGYNDSCVAYECPLLVEVDT